MNKLRINGCPVNGPAIAASGRRVAVAWFTGAAGTQRVKLAFSGDSGESFGETLTVDDGSPVGRVDVLLLDDGSAMVVAVLGAAAKTPRWVYVVGIHAIILALLFMVAHLTGGGLRSH